MDPADIEKPPFFANRFLRLLTKSAAAQDLGPESCWLLAVIATQEDVIRYSRPVTFYNAQLMPLCGFGSPKRLVAARSKAVDLGWLLYEQGGKGVPGKYLVTIPLEYRGGADAGCDEGIFPVPNRNGKEDLSPSDAVPNRNGNGKERLRQRVIYQTYA